jgi:hypothetical protein
MLWDRYEIICCYCTRGCGRRDSEEEKRKCQLSHIIIELYVHGAFSYPIPGNVKSPQSNNPSRGVLCPGSVLLPASTRDLKQEDDVTCDMVAAEEDETIRVSYP